MNLILKIAGGVFLGILAAFGVYKAVDIWERQALAKRLVEQQRLEAVAYQSRISKAAGNLQWIEPEKLIALCGLPLGEAMRGPYRQMYYKGADGHKVNMEFYQGKDSHFYMGMHQADVTTYDLGHPKNYETIHSQSGSGIQIAELPCLIGLADGYD